MASRFNKMIIAPVIFCTVVTGTGKEKREGGRSPAQCTVYFEIAATRADYWSIVNRRSLVPE